MSFSLKRRHHRRMLSAGSSLVRHASRSGWPLLMTLAAVMLGSTPAASEAIRLVPRPSDIESLGGVFVVPHNPGLVLQSPDSSDRFAAELLVAELAERSAGTATISSRGAGAFMLVRTPADSSLGEEGYSLECSRDGVRISAPTSAGLFYGVQTLRQLLTATGVPCVRIRDHPALRWRGVQEDIARAGAPRRAALEHRIALAASFKVNLYLLYTEVSVASPHHPLLAHPGDVLSAADVKALTAFARRHHVALVLEQQSFGHLREVLRHERYRPLALRRGSDTLAPGTATDAFLDSLYADLVPLFDGPFVHVGGDEPDELGEARPSPSSPSDAVRFARYITRRSESLERYSRRIMLWSDFPLAHPATIPLLPPRSVIAVWDYTVRASYDSLLTPFRKAGLDVMVCPGMMNWKRLFPRIDEALVSTARLTRDGIRAGAIGQIACAWGDDGEFLPGLIDYPMAFSAAAAWQGMKGPTAAGFADDFDWVCFRLERHDVADAVALLSGIHGRFEDTGGPDASVRLMDLDPMNPTDHTLLAVIDSTAEVVAKEAERAIGLLLDANAVPHRNDADLDEHLFAARRLHLLATGLAVGRRWLPIYRRALKEQTAHRTVEASRALQELMDLLAEVRNEAFEVRAEHARLLERAVQPGRMELLLLRDERACRRWSDHYDQFSRLLLWCGLGQPLPTERQLVLP